MLHNLIKKTSSLILIMVIFFSGFNPSELFYFLKDVVSYSEGKIIVDKIYLAKQNKNVVDNFLGGIRRAEAAVNPIEREYMIHIGPTIGSTAANYVYMSFFNPVGSGRDIVMKNFTVRPVTGNNTGAKYGNLTLRRITAASGGNLIATTDIPKKNNGTVDSIVEVRQVGPAVTFAGSVDSRVLGQPNPGAVGSYYSFREITFGINDEQFVIAPGEGLAVYQEDAGDQDARNRVYVAWQEMAKAPTIQNEFLFTFPRIETTAGANYVYNSFFNPSASGKTAVIKRIWFGTETCDGNASYSNDIYIKRISAASGGTAIAASDIPKKNTGGATSVMDFRHTNVSVTEVGGSDARLGHVTPCGSIAQPGGLQEINLHNNDEKIILQNNEGIALISGGGGDVDQLVRMAIEWQEINTASTPASQGEYIWASQTTTRASAANTTRYTFYNPSGSGKVAVIKRLAIRINADANANYPAWNFRRLSAASGGLLVTASDLPKKHTGTSNSVMQTRWCGATCATTVSATYIGTADSRLMTVNAPGVVGNLTGIREIVFGSAEKIILKEGEGIGFYNDVLTADVDAYVKILIEWDEETSAPAAAGEYLIDIGPVNGSTATSYNYATFLNPTGSGKAAVIKRLSIRVDTINTASYIPMQLRRLTAASGGTLIAAANIPKKNTSTSNSVMQIRRTGVAATYVGGTDSKLMSVITPAETAARDSGNVGYYEINFENNEKVILKEGEGIGLYHDTSAGDVDLRVKLLVEWEEVATASTPASQQEHIIGIGPITQSTTAGYVYSSFFNNTTPGPTGKRYLIKRIAIRAERTGSASAPDYTTATIRKISSASGGTLMTASNIPKKHQDTLDSSVELRTAGPSVSFIGGVDAQFLDVTIPGAPGQIFGEAEREIIVGDELVLKPGEGIAFYQQNATGDTNVEYRFLVGWREEDNLDPPQYISFDISSNSIYLGELSAISTKYASSTNPEGDTVETVAHTISVTTNALMGYTVSVQGNTLNSGGNVIDAIGGSNTASAVGTKQFGLRAVATGGVGIVAAPYTGSGFAYSSTATTSTQVAYATLGDDEQTDYSVRYVANITDLTLPGEYSANLVYIATANF
ncbi:hypothetical protein K9M47_00690 [Candidatus Gracilibacteria bacterium]|nr:hypothetical protein [Candidatus Gracilibacteria bacterium]MCF7898353.1 hypothetical protein [Candidatus Paceibacterota bacterium]